VDAIYICLSLDDPRVPFVVEAIEASEYFFAGIFPYYHHDNTLVMQYVNNLTFDYDLITCYTSRAQALKNYVKKSDPNKI
jgi:hypothetical protein